MRIAAAVALPALALFAPACRDGAVLPRPLVRLVASTTTSRLLADVYVSRLADTRFELVNAKGSVAVIEAIMDGRGDVGFAFADVAYFAYVDQLTHPPANGRRLRGIAALQVAPVHLLARPGEDLRGVEDLRGRRVVTGEVGSGQDLLSRLVFEAFDLDEESLHAKTLPVAATAKALTLGHVDAAFRTSYYPDDVVTEALQGGARLVPIDGPLAERLSRTYPFVQPLSIPAHTYPGQEAPLRTIGIERLLLSADGVDDQTVYALTETLFEALPDLVAASDSSLKLMDLGRAAATPIPLHRGAALYYRTLELTR